MYTDFATQRRQPKASARWYSALITANAVPDPAAFAGEGSCCLALGAATEARGGRPALAAAIAHWRQDWQAELTAAMVLKASGTRHP